MSEITLSSRYMIRNSNPGGLRLSTPPLGHRGSPQYHKWMGKKHVCFFQTAETGKRTLNSSMKGSGANHYPRAPTHQIHRPENVVQGEVRTETLRGVGCFAASYTIEKVTSFVCLYQLYIQLHHVLSDDLDIFCLIVT